MARLSAALRAEGVVAGDRVAGFMPNVPATVVAMLATTSLGAAWTSCSPDFGVDGVIDRLGQVAPKVLFAADGYVYGGKRFDSLERVRGIAQKLPSLQRIVLVPYLTPAPAIADESRAIALPDYVAAHRADPIAFEPVAFDAPPAVALDDVTFDEAPHLEPAEPAS